MCQPRHTSKMSDKAPSAGNTCLRVENLRTLWWVLLSDAPIFLWRSTFVHVTLGELASTAAASPQT